MTLAHVLANCRSILPELVLVATLCWVILVDMLYPAKESPKCALWTIIGLLVALFPIVATYGAASLEPVTRLNAAGVLAKSGGPIHAFSGMIVIDKLGDFFKALFIVATIGVVILSRRSRELEGARHGEYYALMLASLLGACFLVSSNNFVMLFLSFETLSLCSYVLAGYLKHNRASAEASLKYILYGSVASGVMLFGLSYVYGMTGTLDIESSMSRIAMRETSSLPVAMTFVLLIGGIGFKVAAAPFHFWAPDVYQGSPTPITAFLSVVSKAAGFSALFRITLPLFAAGGPVVPDSVLAVQGSLHALVETGKLPVLFWVLSVLSMTLGNLAAIVQTDVKRLLAYSSIAHAGYILMGMTVFNGESMEAMLFYFFVYSLTNLGAFVVVSIVQNKTGKTDLDAFRGIMWRDVWLFILMFVILISLTGLPPTAGFLGKWKVFAAVVGAGNKAMANVNGHLEMTFNAWLYFSLAIIGALNSAVSLFYYMKVVKQMVFLKPREEGSLGVANFDYANLAVYAIPVALMIIQFGPINDLVRLFNQ